MQTWTREIGTVTLAGSDLFVVGSEAQLYAWAHRSGMSWPAATLTKYARVSAELDTRNGDLLDLNAYLEGERYAEDSDDVDIAGDELTAWIDDNLAGTPFARLARVGAVS